jgi:hypothetical protein
MKNKLSVLLLSVCLTALVFAVPERAEAQNLQTLLSGGTNVVGSNGTLVRYSLPAVVVQRGNKVALQTQFKMNDGNGTTNCTFRFDVSVDNAMWHSNFIVWGVPPTQTVTNSVATNVDIGHFNFLRLNSASNANDCVLTNLILKASQKSGL